MLWRHISSQSRFSVVAATAAASIGASSWVLLRDEQSESRNHVRCEELRQNNDDETSKKTRKTAGFQKDAEGTYHGMFPLRQKWQPRYEYPLWDNDWDGRTFPSTGDEDRDHRTMRQIRKSGVTRHIILVRHGQYYDSEKAEEMQKLTPLGRYQAEQTGKRLAEMLEGGSNDFKPCPIKSLRVSSMVRAIETADIISHYLPGVKYEKPDPLLSEGRPCHHIPGTTLSEKIVEATDKGHARIEAAFQKYFYRADWPVVSSLDDNSPDDDSEKHEFEIMVCHANVIRYFLCRALQLPPEVWLRYCPLNCSLTYIIVRPTGSVSCRMMGDIGHLSYDSSTFSSHHGFVW